MTKTMQKEWTDDEILHALALRDAGLSHAKIGAVLGGRSKNSVIGMLNRVANELAASEKD